MSFTIEKRNWIPVDTLQQPKQKYLSKWSLFKFKDTRELDENSITNQLENVKQNVVLT